MIRALWFLAICFSFPVLCQAQDVKPVEVVGGLNNPCGVALQPDSGVPYICDSGNLRIVRVVDGKIEEVVTNFPKDIYGKGPKYDVGPLGLTFLNKHTLIVGCGGLPDGEELLRVYKIPGPGEPAIDAKDMVTSMSLPAEGEVKGEGNFYGLAVTKYGVFVTSNGDDTKGWIAKAGIEGDKVGPFERSIATKEKTNVDAPVAITVNKAGQLVVGQMGEVTVPNDGLLTFYSPKDGSMLANFETGLSDITGLAYSPKGQLYAVDFSWHNTAEGGLFHVVAEKDSKVKVSKLTVLDKPTACVFGADGTLYITVIGSGENGETKGAGKLLKVAPGL